MNIIVTGASKGIGYEIVKTLAAKTEHNILAISRDLTLLKELQKVCKKPIEIISFDLSADNKQFDVLAAEVLSKMGRIDILINNAGLLINKTFTELTEKDFDALFQINIKSIFLLTQKLLPHFKVGSHIVNISSMGGFQGSAKFKGLSLYSAAKGALSVFSECLAVELEAQKISVNCLALGAVQTEMLEKAFPGYEAPVLPSDMGQFIADFSLNAHKFFNGKVIPVTLSTP